MSLLPFHFETKNGSAKKHELDEHVAEMLIKASHAEGRSLYALLESNEEGLSQEEADAKLRQWGKNEIAHEKALPWYVMLLKNFRNPFVLVLLVLAAVSYFTADIPGTIVVSTMVALSVFMRFLQEYRSSRAAEKLQDMVRTTATVIRRIEKDGKLVSDAVEVPLEELVPGDIVKLSAGDMIPGDVRLLSSKDLFLSQSALTGEAMPVEKYDTLSNVVEKSTTEKNTADTNPLDCGNLCFLGTNILSGSGTAIIVTTGRNTFFGSLAKNVIGYRSETSFDKGINSVSVLLIKFMFVMVPIVFFLNGFMKGNWYDAFLFSIAVAVGLTPEMLPMVVTANLAKGAVSMSKDKVIVKRLNSIQNLGAMDVLCTDKTGTLTQDKIVLITYTNIHGKEAPHVLEMAYFNSYYQTGLKNLLDRAVLEFVDLHKKLRIPETQKIDEIPFDFVRRRMTVVIDEGHEHLLICKGALEEILPLCVKAEEGEKLVDLTPHIREQALKLTTASNVHGLRVIAVAYKRLPRLKKTYGVQDEQDLVLVGFISFLDPPKDSAAPAIEALQKAGITVKILTGDNDIVTRRVCKEVKLHVQNLTLGNEIEHLSDEELADIAERTTVFAKITPMQKARIIRAIQSKGHTVGFMGDGINDAAALRDADVGISVDTATDIAKESADVILLEKSLMVLSKGVIRGREIYGNIIKYIKMTASSNFGNVFSVLTASAFIPFLPMEPLQFLVQNLFYDISQTSLPWDRMDQEFLLKPRKWDPSGIAKFMLCVGPISSVFDITTFALMWFVFGANTEAHKALFQSGWFIEGLLTQTLIVHVIRTRKIPFIESVAALPVMLMTSAIMVIGIVVPFTPLGHSIGLVPVPGAYFPFLVITLLAYCVLMQGVKTWYIRRFKAWL